MGGLHHLKRVMGQPWVHYVHSHPRVHYVLPEQQCLHFTSPILAQPLPFSVIFMQPAIANYTTQSPHL